MPAALKYMIMSTTFEGLRSIFFLLPNINAEINVLVSRLYAQYGYLSSNANLLIESFPGSSSLSITQKDGATEIVRNRIMLDLYR